MKTIVQVKVVVDAAQREILLRTMESFNQAAEFAAEVGHSRGLTGNIDIHKVCYFEVRERFGLKSQMAVRAIAKAADALLLSKKRKNTLPKFRPWGAIVYDQRNFSLKGETSVSLGTLEGRMVLPIVYGDYQRERFPSKESQADLIYRKGCFYLNLTTETPEDEEFTPVDYLGVDLGVVNLAVDSDGEVFAGEDVEKVRKRTSGHRRRLQARGSKSAKRRLCRIRKREADFRKNTNHCIAKKIVEKAKGTECGIAIEDLAGVTGDGKRFRHDQRSRMKGWGFDQLRRFIEYKARLGGVPLVVVDPAYTSRTCSECGCCEKENRRSRDEFVCTNCGFECPADLNAARNIRTRAVVDRPTVGVA